MVRLVLGDLDSINPSFTPQHTQGLSYDTRTYSTRIEFINRIQQHQTHHKHPNISILAGSPPAFLNANLPKTVNADPRHVQEVIPPSLPFQEAPHASKKATPEPSLGWHDCPREEVLEQTDASPACAKGAADEHCHSQDLFCQLIEFFDGVFQKQLVAREREETEYYGKELGKCRDSAEEESYVGAHAGRFVGVKESA